MKRVPLYLTLMIFALVSFAGCSGGDNPDFSKLDKEDLAARIDDWTLTKDQLFEAIAQMPEQQRAKYDSHQGRAELAGKFMEEELWYREALAEDLEKDPDVKKLLDQTRRSLLARSYFTKYIEQAARPTDQEIHDYYDAHQDVYTTLEVARAQHIFSTDPDKLEELKKRILESGEKMTVLARKYSEDKLTRDDGGDLGYFNPGGYIRGVGYSERFSEAVFSSDLGELVGPVKWEKGYSLIRVSERRPPTLRPYDEVKEEIAKLMSKDRIDAAQKEFFTRLNEKFKGENYMEEYFKAVERSPEELWNLAQATSAPQERIRTFQEIVDKFPDDEHASQAMFMIGFVYAEELGDKVSADKAWNTLLSTYPDTDVAETARWMLDHMDSPLPKFESIDELNKKVQTD